MTNYLASFFIITMKAFGHQVTMWKVIEGKEFILSFKKAICFASNLVVLM